MAKKQAFEFFLDRLIKGYRSYTGKEPEGLDLIKVKQEARQKFIEQDKIIPFPQKKSFGQEVDEMIAKGEVNIGEAPKTPTYQKPQVDVDFEIQERLNSDNKKAIKAFEERMKNKPDDMATGGRAGYYMGGTTSTLVGEDLSDISHGSDSLMARNMQLSPGGQATTSTGLNYLLGQDNDTVRVPYNKGKIVKEVADKGRRGFIKAAGAGAAGLAALKTGLLGFGEKVAPVAYDAAKDVEKIVKGVPPYFMKLVNKIRKLGDDAPNLATLDRQKVTKYKDFELTEDITTGRMEITRMKVTDPDSASYYGQPLTEETYMSFTPGEVLPGKGKMKPLKTADEYEEGTALLRSDGMNAGEVVEESAGISDDIFEEVGEQIPEAIRKTKADGGRIGYGKGDIVTKGIPALIKAGEGKFTKAQYLIERIKNTIKGNPDDKYVQETFPNFIKELEANPDLAKNENVFKELGGDLPEGQKIVVYGDDTLDFFTESSGPQNIKKIDMFMEKHGLSRDKALEIMKMEPDDQVMELTKTNF